ncbi:hypothetical protein H9L05_09210 [Hymenobacter qilianensis]|uniref:Uncharacterized protein n=1 Tax=Hymenobacter qilianensis TaxID=1385715 RepID=A0A7H0GZH8_9BACT|nr:hypothetical protein [Hymenobacter qilianensis]QNP53694.1 hypothetical protein H9L05_09210 [Hymenobacter qilianensis]
MNGERLNFGRLASEFRFYLTPNFPFQLTWAGRIGGARNLGDYRFYQANTLGAPPTCAATAVHVLQVAVLYMPTPRCAFSSLRSTLTSSRPKSG